MPFTIPDPPPAKKSVIEADAPQLLPLLGRFPKIRIYTRTNDHFEEIKRVLASGNEDVPLAVVRVTSEDEIAATIRLCEDAALPLSVRSGGNDFGNRNYVEGAVVIDVRLLCSISIAEDRQSVVIGGGVTHGQLLQTLDRESLDTPVGWGGEIGYVGWACGGGYGLEVGHRGLGVDQILGGRVVIPSGQVIVAGPSFDDDAFWSLRGGGAGMFGVVSQLTVRVYPRPSILAGNVVFPMSGITDLFGNFEKLYAENFPDNFSGEAFVLNPPQSGGIVNHFFCWHLKADLSDLAAAKEYLERIKSCGVVLNETVKQTTPYEFLFTIETPALKDRRYFSNTSCTVRGFTKELGAVLSKYTLPTNISCIVLHTCHGVGAKADAYGAFGNRANHLLVGICASCPYNDTTTKEAIASWPKDILDDLIKSQLPLPGKYVNFNPREPGDGKMYFGGDGLKRMRTIKQKFDPRNIFAINTPDLGS